VAAAQWPPGTRTDSSACADTSSNGTVVLGGETVQGTPLNARIDRYGWSIILDIAMDEGMLHYSPNWPAVPLGAPSGTNESVNVEFWRLCMKSSTEP
jgi:hypothetical protein